MESAPMFPFEIKPQYQRLSRAKRYILILFIIFSQYAFCAESAKTTNHFLPNIFQTIGLDDKLVRRVKILDWSLDQNAILSAFDNKLCQIPVNLSLQIAKKASGLGLKAWQFRRTFWNDIFRQLFNSLANHSENFWGFAVNLSDEDLFHGHVFEIELGDGTDIAVLFHSKEYPNDPDLVYQNGGLGKDSNFSSNSLGFINRNFLWLNSTKIIINFDGDYIERNQSELFLPEDSFGLPADLRDFFLKSKTIQTEKIPGFIRRLGDVNFFVIDSEKPKKIFFTYEPQQ